MHGTLSLAAEKQHITQSAASQRLREAERRLGIALTYKKGRTIVLTEAAQHIAYHAAQAERVLQAAESEAQWISRAAGQRLRLALTTFDHFDFLPALSAELAAKNINLNVHRHASDDISRLLSDGHADIMLLPAPLMPSGTNAIQLWDDEFVCVMPRHHELAAQAYITPEDLREVRYITYSVKPTQGFEYDLFFSKLGAMPSIINRVESLWLLLDMVRAGRGVSILPKLSALPSLKTGEVIMRALAPEGRLQWRLAYRDAVTQAYDIEQIAHAFTSVIEQSIADHEH